MRLPESAMPAARSIALAVCLLIMSRSAAVGERGLILRASARLAADRPWLVSRLVRLRGGGGDRVACRFEVQVETTKPGDAVVLLGSGKALHNWDTSQALVLRTSPQDFPWWFTDVELSVGLDVEFKFAIRCADTSALAWEPGNNRHAVIPDDASPVLSCVFADDTHVQNFGRSPLQSETLASEVSSHSTDLESLHRTPRRKGTEELLSAGLKFNALTEGDDSQADASPAVLHAHARAAAASPSKRDGNGLPLWKKAFINAFSPFFCILNAGIALRKNIQKICSTPDAVAQLNASLWYV